MQFIAKTFAVQFSCKFEHISYLNWRKISPRRGKNGQFKSNDLRILTKKTSSTVSSVISCDV